MFITAILDKPQSFAIFDRIKNPSTANGANVVEAILVDDEGGFVGIRTANGTAFSNGFKGHASMLKVLAAELIGKRLPAGVSAEELLASFEKLLPDLGADQHVDRQSQHELSV